MAERILIDTDDLRRLARTTRGGIHAIGDVRVEVLRARGMLADHPTLGPLAGSLVSQLERLGGTVQNDHDGLVREVVAIEAEEGLDPGRVIEARPTPGPGAPDGVFRVVMVLAWPVFRAPGEAGPPAPPQPWDTAWVDGAGMVLPAGAPTDFGSEWTPRAPTAHGGGGGGGGVGGAGQGGPGAEAMVGTSVAGGAGGGSAGPTAHDLQALKDQKAALQEQLVERQQAIAGQELAAAGQRTTGGGGFDLGAAVGAVLSDPVGALGDLGKGLGDVVADPLGAIEKVPDLVAQTVTGIGLEELATAAGLALGMTFGVGAILPMGVPVEAMAGAIGAGIGAGVGHGLEAMGQQRRQEMSELIAAQKELDELKGQLGGVDNEIKEMLAAIDARQRREDARFDELQVAEEREAAITENLRRSADSLAEMRSAIDLDP